LPQNQRDTTLSEARKREIDIIVATDVASRGIDLPGVELVIHCGFPKDSESYVHRSGRAGRPGCASRGCALTLHFPEDGGKVSAFIESETNVRVKRLSDVREACSFVIDAYREKSDENFREERVLIEKKQRLGENILISQRFQMLDEELDCLSLKQNNSRNKKKR
jgi:superfamily II DNA/RNA helicase